MDVSLYLQSWSKRIQNSLCVIYLTNIASVIYLFFFFEIFKNKQLKYVKYFCKDLIKMST